MNKTYFLSKYNFSKTDAGALRTEYLSTCFAELGYFCIFTGFCSGGNYLLERDFIYGKCINFRNNSSKIKKIFSYLLLEKHLLHYIKNNTHENDIIVVCSFFSIDFLKKLNQFCLFKKVKLIFSVVERYNKPSFNNSFLDKVDYFCCEQFFKYGLKFNRPIIGISSYICEFFNKKGLKTVLIPFVFSNKLKTSRNITYEKGSKKTIIYAGNPGNKDNLSKIIEAIRTMPNHYRDKIEFKIYGVDESWRIKNGIEPDSCVYFLGKVDNNVVIEAYKESSFSILIRDPGLISSIAGFPTKVVESLHNGLPVISNLTGDLSRYLNLNVCDCVFVQNFTVEDIRKALISVVLMSNEQIKQINQNCVDTFNKFFVARIYTCKIQELLGEKK